MASRWLRIVVVASCAALASLWGGAAGPAGASPVASADCSAGAHTLAPPGSRLYPETGNGGYTSLHTLVQLVYNAGTNRFLPGNRVSLTDRATQCLTSFSLDFERHSANTKAGPNMQVNSVTVNGVPATFSFVQPTYPGDPSGQDDPNPAAHEASENNPVGGPLHNPLPPACTPELPNTNVKTNSMDGTQCPANKLVVVPPFQIAKGAVFTVAVNYTGTPGVHNDGDGTTEGWFRASDGGFVTTEPVGSEDWMPLNDYPAAKPTYDFSDTVAAGRSAIANGVLVSVQHHPASTAFPNGSETWNWHSEAPIASYLVEDSIGNYRLTKTLVNGMPFYRAQDTSISPADRKANLAVMRLQANITAFESRFTGPFPFTSDGIIIGTPPTSFDEEMETMIAFSGGGIDTDTLYHENMHQWWGDNVSEGDYRLTYFKEGLATFSEFLYGARRAQQGSTNPTAFQASLVSSFNTFYKRGGGFWTVAPSNPKAVGLFSGSSTYVRPGIGYIALRQILGHTNFTKALEQIQRVYGGKAVSEPQLEAAFAAWLPVQSQACQTRLSQFFGQWWDTAYPKGGGVNRPTISGPGLDGPNFYSGACKAAA